MAGTGKAWGTGCAFVDYNRDGRLDLMVANYVKLDIASTPAPGDGTFCVWKGVPVMCGPRGLPGGTKTSCTRISVTENLRTSRKKPASIAPTENTLSASPRSITTMTAGRTSMWLRQRAEYPLSQQSRRHFH